jgi:hypothetical protein
MVTIAEQLDPEGERQQGFVNARLALPTGSRWTRGAEGALFPNRRR